MLAAVHAVLVVRPEGRDAASHLRRTIAALRAQSRPLHALTIVLCGQDRDLLAIAAESGAEGIVSAGRGTGYAAAVRLATPRLSGDAVWLLAQDTAPEPEALDRLAGALELAPSVAIVAPKLVRWDDRAEIVSLGVTVTRYGRTVGLVEGELDQGQHDRTADVLGTDVRGLLVRTEVWRRLEGLDPALGGADEGLDLGIRARLAGDRVSVAPEAVVAVAGEGIAGLPDPRSAPARRRRAFSTRRARLQRRLAYAPAAVVPLHWLSLLPLALWRTVLHLLGKAPARVGPEWAATLAAIVRLGGVARARRIIRRTRRVPWSRLSPLRVTREQLRARLDADSGEVLPPGAVPRPELRFFSGGGAWLVLGALAVSVAAFPALVAWPSLGGGALAPLASDIGRLWADAAFGLRATGLGGPAPADPFAAVVAVIGTLAPADPSRALVWLWLLALPLAVLGGWFAATRLSERALVRGVFAVAWALAPTFLVALMAPRPAAVVAHLLLPWLFYTASVAHRSWASAGAASLLLAAVVACAPSLAPALAALWIVAILLVAIGRRGRGVARIVWIAVPAVALAAPLVWWQVRAGSAWSLLADPGVVWAGPQAAADAAGRALLATGFPTADPGGWAGFLEAWGVAAPTWWVPILILPFLVLAVVAPLTPRFLPGILLVVVALTGIATAFAAVGIAVSASGDVVVALWPGAGLSLAWLGIVGAAAVTLDGGFAPRDVAGRRIVATVAVATLCGLAVPMLTALDRGVADLRSGTGSTLPAFVAAEAADRALGTLVLTPTASGGLDAAVVWGPSATLGGASTTDTAAHPATAADRELADLAVAAVTPSDDDVVARLAARGVGFVLLAPAASTDAGRALELSAVVALDRRAELDAVGVTARGTLWRLSVPVVERADPSAAQVAVSRTIVGVQLLVVLIALLLSIPTAATRRAARYAPRVVGARTEIS